MRARFVLTFSIGWLFALPAQGQESLETGGPENTDEQTFKKYEGQLISSAPRLECDTVVCEDPDKSPVLHELVGIESGQLLDKKTVTAASNRLSRTGYFQSVAVQVTPVKGGVELVFRCEGHVTIIDLDVDYTGGSGWYPRLFVAEIRKRLPYRRGGKFPPADELGQPSAQALEQFAIYQDRVANLYRQQGYEGTKVEIVPKYYGPNFKKVWVQVRVTEGRQPELGQVLVHGADSFPYWRILSHLSTGERVDLLRDWFGLFGIARYSRRRLKNELLKVEADYRDSGYVRARVRLEPVVVRENTQVYPRVRISEGPHLETRFRGNKRLNDEDLRSVLTFKSAGSFDSTELEASRQAIISAYHSIAYFYVTVDAIHTRMADKKHRVTFEIIEGDRVYIRRVEITGNKRVKTDEVLDTMESKGIAEDGVISGLSTSAGVVQRERIINDLLAIRALYAERGMTHMRFLCGEEGTALDTWTSKSNNPTQSHCYEVKRDEDPRLVILRVGIEEGPQTLVDELQVGTRFLRQLDEETEDQAYALLQKFGFKDSRNRWQTTGLNRRKISAVKAYVLSCLNRDGYISPTVSAVCPRPDDEDTVCSDERMLGYRFPKVEFRIDRGRQTRAQGVLLRGNLRTEPQVLLNELLFEEGDPLGSDEIINSQASIRSLGIFDTVNLQLIPRGPLTGVENADGATVVVTVEESKAIAVNFLMGLKLELDETTEEEDSPLLIEVGGGVSNKNFLGRALEVGLHASYINAYNAFLNSYQNDDAEWDITAPYLINRRFLDTRLEFRLTPSFEQGRTGQRDAYARTWAGEANLKYDFYNLSRPADWGRNLHVQLSVEYAYQQERPIRENSLPAAPFGESQHSVTLATPVTWDRRDDALHPTRGWQVHFKPELVFKNVRLTQVAKKVTLSGQWVQSLFEKRLILVPFLRLGAVWMEDSNPEPKSDFLFKAGGDGVTHPIRGYDDASVEACNGVDLPSGICRDVYPTGVSADDQVAPPKPIGGRALLLGSIEARFPVTQINHFWLAAFFDFGAVGESWDAVLDGPSEDGAADPNNPLDTVEPESAPAAVRSSVGLGLRYLVQGQIPLRLDAAYPLGESVFSDQELQFHINIFYSM